MSEPIAYLNGEILPLSQARLPVWDMGVVHGAAVTEMTRTFGHVCFRLEDHTDRLFRALRYVGFQTDLTPGRLRNLSLEIVEHNARLVPPEQDLGLVQFLTAGENLTYLGASALDTYRRPTVCVHTFPLPFELWAAKSQTGQHLVTPSVRHIPPQCLEPKLKHRSRLHWYLADEQARLVDPQASALLLDLDGDVTETASGNFFIVRKGEILTPTTRNILEGVSRQVVRELAAGLGLGFRETDLQPYHALNADEAFTSSTPYCLLPVTRINQTPIGDGLPGAVFLKLMAAWSKLAGLDILAQTRKS